MQLFGIYAACIGLMTLVSSTSYKTVERVTNLGGYWHMIGVPILIVIIPAVATSHATPQWVFTQWIDSYAKEESGIQSPFYIFMLGLLLPGFSFIGYDGPAHMAEEVADAANATPRSILVGFFFMTVVGWVWLVSMLFCITVSLVSRVPLTWQKRWRPGLT